MIVVTAPTGHIGSKLIPRLLARHQPLRVVVRDPDKLPPLVREQVEVVTGSHRNPEVIDRALEGATSLFWLMPSAATASSPYEAYVSASIPGADAVVHHHVPRVVIVSALGRGSQIYAGHVSASHAMEDLFRSTGAHLRALAMPTFMDNLLRQVPTIKDGAVSATLPPDLRMPWVATDDIAEVAAQYLLDQDWTGQDSVDVMGAEDLSYTDIVAVLSEVLERPIRFVPGDRNADRQFLIDHGFSQAMAQSAIDMDIAGERGINSRAKRTPAAITPTTFRAFAEKTLKPAVTA